MMEGDPDRDINEVLEESRRVDLALLMTAKQKATEKLREDPADPAALDVFTKATQALDDFARKEQAKDEDVFPSRIEVHKYLRHQGYKIGRSRFYQQCPLAGGWLKVERDGSVLASSVMRYIKRAGLKRLGGQDKSFDKKQTQKLEAEIMKTEQSAKRIQMQNLVAEGKYRLVAEIEQEQAIKAGALSVGLDHMFTVYVRESIRLVEGNLKRSRSLKKFWGEKKREVLDAFARMGEVEIEVFDDGKQGVDR